MFSFRLQTPSPWKGAESSIKARRRIVSSGDHAPDAPRALSKARMEGFSDGVFGFAITLLVLDLAIRGQGPPLQQLLDGWPSYAAYVISFLTIGAAWLGHTAMTDQLDRADRILLRINLLLLMMVVFLPYPTRLIADALKEPSGERVFITLYGLTLLVIRALLFALDAYAKHAHLYSTERRDQDLSTDRRKRLPTLAAYAIAILIGLAWPILAITMYFGIALYVVVPFREVARAFRRSEPQP